MGLSFIASVQGYSSLTGTTVNCSSALNVAAGDLLVAWTEWQSAATGDTVIVDENDGTDVFTNSTPSINSNDIGGCFSYLIDAPADASFTPRTTISQSSRRIAIIVLQFRPDSGETVSLAVSATPAVGSGTAAQSNNVSFTGDDVVAVGGVSSADGGSAPSNEQIADTAADGAVDLTNYYSGMWWKFFTTAQSNIHAQCTVPNDLWVCDIIAFKSEAAAGGMSIPIAMDNYRRRRV